MDAARRRDAAALGAILIAAALLRLACLRTQPWLDEIWSINLARNARSVADVLFGIHHDNSHPLNTLWLYLVGGRDWAVWRLLSFVCGLLTVAALGIDREDSPRGLLAAALAAVSVPLVLYSTEARGYAPMGLFAVLCRRLLRSPARLAPGPAASFALCATLGMLSQPIFVCVLAALGVEAAVQLPSGKRGRGLLVLFGPTAALVALLAVLQTGRMTFGGGAVTPFWNVVFRTLAQWSGARGSGPTAVFGAAALAGLCAWEFALLLRERSDQPRFLAVLFTGTALFVAAFPYRYERHFFACAPFALLLAAGSLARLFRGGAAAKTAGAVLTSLFLLGNALRVGTLATAGRGHYLEAVQRMARDTPGDVVTVGSDHDFRNRMVLDFYVPYAATPKRFRYMAADACSADASEWYLRSSSETDPRAPAGPILRGGGRYGLVETYPYAGLSGWTWTLYRREGRTPK